MFVMKQSEESSIDKSKTILEMSKNAEPTEISSKKEKEEGE